MKKMIDREKLMELLEAAESAVYWNSGDKSFVEKIADHLIANGVTVQEWIPVEDGLPEDGAEVNLFTRSRIVGSGYYDKYTKRWVQYHSGGAIYADVTRWKPLPEPPKEDDNAKENS